MTYILVSIIDRTMGLRVTEDEEYVGLDICQHGERAEGIVMKIVKAIIKPEFFDLVKKALEDKGVTAMTTTEVQGRGEQQVIIPGKSGKPDDRRHTSQDSD